MTKIFFRQELEGVATFWRILRRDGCTLGFISHNRDLRFDGVLHRAAPGMVPSAIRRSAGLEQDSAEVAGSLAHDAISAADIAAGRFDGACIIIGVIDWETGETATLYRGTIGAITEEKHRFEAELQSAKAELKADTIPRTSPTCRSRFCGPGCSLSPARFTHEALCEEVDHAENRVRFSAGPGPELMKEGALRWIDGPQAGIEMEVVDAGSSGLVLDVPLESDLQPGARALLREGCDHTLATCRQRFGNGVNFRGEPFLPGNDLLTRYPTSAS